MVGNIKEGIININYKVIREVLIEVYFEVITKKNIIFCYKAWYVVPKYTLE